MITLSVILLYLAIIMPIAKYIDEAFFKEDRKFIKDKKKINKLIADFKKRSNQD